MHMVQAFSWCWLARVRGLHGFDSSHCPHVVVGAVRFDNAARQIEFVLRGEVFAVITAACGNPVSVAALDTQFSCNTKGYLQKLIEKNHIVPCSETGEVSSAAAAPAADVAE